MMMTSQCVQSRIHALCPDLQKPKQHTMVQNCDKRDGDPCHVPPNSDSMHGVLLAGEVTDHHRQGMLHHSFKSGDIESVANIGAKGNTRDALSLYGSWVDTGDGTTHGLNESHNSCVQSEKNIVNTSDIVQTMRIPSLSPGSESARKPPPSPSPESVRKPSPSPESVRKPPPSPGPESVRKPPPSPSPESVRKPPPSPSPESVRKPQLSPSPESVRKPLPSPSPESVRKPPPSPSPESVRKPPPSPSPESVRKPLLSPSPESVRKPQLSPSPESVRKPQLSPSPESVRKPLPSPSPESVRKPQLSPSPESVRKPPSPGPESSRPHKMDIDMKDSSREYIRHFPQKGRSGAVPQDDVAMCYEGGGREEIPGHGLPYQVGNMSARCETLPLSTDSNRTSPGSGTLPPWNIRRSDPVNFQELAGNVPPPPPPPPLQCLPQSIQNNNRDVNSHLQNKRKMPHYDAAHKRRGPHIGHQGKFPQYPTCRTQKSPQLSRQTYPISPTWKSPTGRTPSQSSPQFIPPRIKRLQEQNKHGHGTYRHPNPQQQGDQNHSPQNQNYSQRGYQDHWSGQDQQHSLRRDQNHSQQADQNYSQPNTWQHRDQSPLHRDGLPNHSLGMHSREGNLFSHDNHSGYSPHGHSQPPWHGNAQRESQNMPQKEEFDVSRGYNQNSCQQNQTDCINDRLLLAPSVDLGAYEPPPIPPPDHPEHKTNPAICTDTQSNSQTENGAEGVGCGGESPDVFDDGYEEKLLRELFDSDNETIDSTNSTTNSPVLNRGQQTGVGDVASTTDRQIECETGESIDGGPHVSTGNTVGEATRPSKLEKPETVDGGTNNKSPVSYSEMVKKRSPAEKPSAPPVPREVGATELLVPGTMEDDEDCCQDFSRPETLPSSDVSDHTMVYDVQVPSPDTKNPEIANIAANSLPDSSQENVAPSENSEKHVYIPPHKRRTAAVSDNTGKLNGSDGWGAKAPTLPQLEGSKVKQKGSHNESPFKHPHDVNLNPSWRKPRVYDPPLSMHIFTPPSVDILCDESWSPDVKNHDETPLDEALKRTDGNASSQRKLFSASENSAGLDIASQALGGGNTLDEDGRDKKSTVGQNLVSKCVDQQRDTEQCNSVNEEDVLVSFEKQGIRRTYSDSVIGKENVRINHRDKPTSCKDGVQGESGLILTAKEPPRQQPQRRNKHGGRHSLGALQGSRHSLGLGATLGMLKGSFQGDQALTSNTRNLDNDCGPPDWFDDPDNAAKVTYTYTPPTTTNNNRFSVLAALDDNSSARDSDASPSVNLKARLRRTRWSDPPPPSLMDIAVPAEEQKWQKTFREHYNCLNTVYFDTHCHLDFILKRSKFQGSYEKYRMVNKWTYPDTYAGCLAVFCDPRTFGNHAMLRDMLADPTVWGAVGCHPKCATEFDSGARKNLIEMLKVHKVKAVGEIGLDYSGTFHQHKDRQIEVFRDQIQIALDIGFPLVIHSRDAEEDCLRILREMVPSMYRIHRHCFTGCWAEAAEWLRYFPESYIGLTPLMTHSGGRSIAPREVARNIPLDRLLLETDAPYFLPKQIPRDAMLLSHPGMAVTVAAEVARLQGVDVKDVLAHCLQNSEKMYGITINKTPGAHWPTQTQL